MQKLLSGDRVQVQNEANTLLATGWEVVAGTTVLYAFQATTTTTLDKGLPIMVERMAVTLQKKD